MTPSSSFTAQTLVEDILSIILLECLPEDSLSRNRQNEAPMSVSQVCRHWRTVSLSTHRLWASLYLNCSSNEITLENALPTLHLFFQRSGSVNLHLEFDCLMETVSGVNIGPRYIYHGPESCVDNDHVEMILHELLIYAGRIRSFTLLATVPISTTVFGFMQNGKLPDLGSLSLNIHRGMMGRETVYMKDPYREVIKCLRSLEFAGRVDYHIDFTCGVAFPVLQKLILRTAAAAIDIFRILLACPVLKELYIKPSLHSRFTVNCPISTHDIFTSFPTIQLLEVEINGNNTLDTDVLDFLQSVQLPNLTRLIVRHSGPYVNALKTFLLASHPPLQEFYLFTTTFEGGDDRLPHILPLLPNLKKLRVPTTQAVLRALLLSNRGGGGACPLLEEITFAAAPTKNIKVRTWNVMRDVIHSRWRAPNTSSHLSGLGTTESTDAASPVRMLKQVILPIILERDWETHPLYDSIEDCRRGGLVVSLGRLSGRQ